MPTSASPPTHKRFDYASLDAETCQLVQQHTGEIRGLMKRTAQGIVEIGQKLIEVKERLEYGRFGYWLEAEFDWSYETAARFIRVYVQFSSVNLAELSIAPSALYELAAPSTPEAARKEAISRAKSGEAITYTSAKALKQKYAAPPTKPKPELEPEPVSQPQPSPTPEPLSQSGAKPQIVMIRRHLQAMASAQPLVVPQPSVLPAPTKPGVWWQLGGRHLLYCGDPNSPEFLERIASEQVSLMLAFPPTPEWHSRIRAEVRLMMADYLPQFHNPDQLDEALESAILLYSRLNTLVVSCFLPSPEILSIINRLDRRGLFAEPDSRRCSAVISDWKRGGLKAERLA